MVVIERQSVWERTTDDVFWGPGETAPVREADPSARKGRVVIADRVEAVLSVHDEYENTRRKMEARYMPVDAKRYLLDPAFRMGAVKTGDEKLRDLCNAVTALNHHSVKIHGHPIPNTHLYIMQLIISTLLEKIYGDEYETRKPYLLRLFGMPFFRMGTFVSMFRRSGKSELVAMVVAAYAVSQPTSTTCIYSVGKRASTLLSNKIATHIQTLMGANMAFEVKNDERMVFRNPSGGLAEICSYPANKEVRLFYFRRAVPTR